MKNKIKNMNETEKLLGILNLLEENESDINKREHFSNIIERLDKRIGKESVKKEGANEN